MTRQQIIEMLRERQGDRGLREFAREVGCTAANLSGIYLGKWNPGKQVAQYLGFVPERGVTYSEEQYEVADDGKR